MTTNQTIDGVPREAVAALEKARDVLRSIILDKAAGVHYASAQAACHQINATLDELRTLLDEPVEPAGSMISVKPDVLRALFAPNANAVQLRDAKDAARKAYEDWSIAGQHPAAQPQGEPVANPVLMYADSYRAMARQGVETVSIWSVITDLERNIAPLYAEQPAPVAVVMPERNVIRTTKPIYIDGTEFAQVWNACLDEVKRLNS